MADRPNYALGYGDLLIAAFGQRSSTREAQFLLPHLTRGMRLLDCGCGPGTITVGLAGLVAPGQVTGIDIATDQFSIGRELAAKHGLDTVSFEQGDLTELRFEDDSFDAAFAHGVLYHLSNPRAALAEIKRVLRPGGILGIRDTDEGGTLLAPRSPQLERAYLALVEALHRNGGDPYFGRRQRSLLRQTGFEPISFTASYDNYSAPAQVRGFAKFAVELLRQPGISTPLLESGWSTTQELEAMCAVFEDWGTDSSAFIARARCETVAIRA